MARLDLSGIRRSFGSSTVLDGVDLSIRDGEFLSLVGPSGCGKTTLLRIVAGLDHADAGTVRIDGTSVDALAPKRRDVAMVFQSYALYPYMTVAQNMALPLTMRRLSWPQRLPVVGGAWPGARAVRQGIDRDVRQVAESLGLATLLDRRPAQLSGGQRQRVALGRAMVRRPKAFLMDEPLSNLDAQLRVDTRAEIADLHRRLGTTFVYVTHDQVEAMTMSDRVALMMDGRILQLGTPQELYDDPVDLRVAEFIGTPKVNVLEAVARADGVGVGLAVWPLQVPELGGGPLSLAVRPEAWRIRKATVGVDAADHRATVQGVVRHREALGSETLVHVTLAHQARPVIVRAEPTVARDLDLGDAVHLAVDLARVMAFDPAGRRTPVTSMLRPGMPRMASDRESSNV